MSIHICTLSRTCSHRAENLFLRPPVPPCSSGWLVVLSLPPLSRSAPEAISSIRETMQLSEVQQQNIAKFVRKQLDGPARDESVRRQLAQGLRG